MKVRNWISVMTEKRTRVDCSTHLKLTVPDQTLPMRVIISKLQNGNQLDIGKEVYYSGEEIDETKDPDFDLSSYSKVLDEVEERKKELEKVISEEKKLKKAKKVDAAASTSNSEDIPQRVAEGKALTERNVVERGKPKPRQGVMEFDEELGSENTE